MKTKPVLTSAELDPMLAAARTEAVRRGLAMSIAIVDDGGYPLRLERMDGAGAMTPSVALAKARTAALMRGSTRLLAERVKTEPALLRLTDYLPMEGGLPIMAQGVCVGGIGISGGKPDDDEGVGQAGIDGLQE
ncbi:MAG: heme-binding protein [Pseudomonadota bacterium]|uniref:GlcG/HbpS family heme-binding protein n=1 Tax=Sphingomonas sp. ERG5 TaxID=1381597 RepID=UPI00054B8E8A|nr:heme-binding protein [Sphingomonas sp. ERG5]